MSMFAELANVKAKDVKEPVALPTGHYQAMITGMMQEHKAKSGNVAMRFPCRLLEAGDDVDQEALQESLAAGKPLAERTFTMDFWMSPEARYRFTNFTKAMGISDDLNLLEQAEELATAGVPFLIEVKQEVDSRDATKSYTRYDNPAPLA